MECVIKMSTSYDCTHILLLKCNEIVAFFMYAKTAQQYMQPNQSSIIFASDQPSTATVFDRIS